MTDQRLRELERRAHDSGAPDDRIAWLRERLRCGQLTARGLHLLAYVGDATAREVFGGDPNDVTALLENDVLYMEPGDPHEEILAALRQTLGQVGVQLKEIARGLAAAGYRCAGVGTPRPPETVALAADMVREHTGGHVPALLTLWDEVIGPQSFVGYDHFGEACSPEITAWLKADPLEVDWNPQDALDWADMLEELEEDEGEDGEEDALERYGTPFAPDPGHKANVSSSGAYRLLLGTRPCLDARVRDDDSVGLQGTFLGHVRAALAGGGFLAVGSKR